MACTSCNKIVNKVISIGTGYKNILISNEQLEPIAKEREVICNNCEFIKEFIKIGNTTVYSCSLCSCPIKAKTRSNDKCPKGKW